MSVSPPQISLGLTYWPRRAGYDWWRAVDRAAMQDELAHIADLGCDTVRFCLTWEDFQPGGHRIGGPAMRVLEHALDAAHSAGLRVVPLLFPAAIGGALTLPSWANGASLIDELTGAGGIGPTLRVQSPGSLPVLYEGSYHTNQAHDLFSYRPILAAQRFLVGEVVGYFGVHPAIAAWQIGEGFERVRRPASVEVARVWYSTMADLVRERRAGAHVLGVTSLRAMSTRSGPRPEQMIDGCDLLGVVGDPPEPPSEPSRHTTFVAFVHALAAGLSDRPAIVTSLGMPTIEGSGGTWQSEPVYGRVRRVFYGDLEQQAAFVEAAIERLARAGAPAIWLAAYADAVPEQWRVPPLDHSPRARTLGLVDITGREKPAAGVLRAIARRLRSGAAPATGIARQRVDPERHWHDPRASIAELWGGFEQPT